LHEIFLYPFEAAVKEASLGSIMNSYSEIDGLPCCASKKLFKDILRTSWEFDGIVVSDYSAINMLYEYHKTARTKQEAANQALLAGIDVELPSTDCYGEPLKKALEDGIISMEELDAVVKWVLQMKFRLGIFEHPYVESDKAMLAFETEDQRKLSYTLATESIVLLKNDNLLPLSPDIKSLAVIGPNANNWRNMIGDYAYPCHIETLEEMRDKDNPFGMPIPDDIGDISDALNVVTILEAIKTHVSSQTEVLFAQGCDVIGNSKEGLAEAIEVAKKADVAVLVVGDKSGLTEGCTTGEARDMAGLQLPGVQEKLIQAVYETGTPTVVILVSGRPYELNWAYEHVQAIIAAWLPGEEGGNAVADVLFGKVNPGGKLPISFPRSVGQIPVYYAHRPSGGRSHWTGNYVDISASPLYPFGHGLSYTTFSYENLNVDNPTIHQDGNVNIELDVQNTGDREGDEVVQFYIHYKPSNCSITRPVKELKGFKRIRFNAGEKKHLTFTLYAHQLAFYQEDMSYAVNPGEVEVMIGSSSEDIRLTGAFTISGESAQVVEKKIFFSDVTISE
jgi:beta-glucosidase